MKRRLTGLLVPPWCLSHQGDFGIGDLASLRKFIPWVSGAGISFLDLVSIQESFNGNPGQAISFMALDPIYLDPSLIPEVWASELSPNTKKSDRVNYSAVKEAKHKLFRRAFQRFYNSNEQDPAFSAFQEKNKDWLSIYSIFKYIQSLEGTINWKSWNRSYNSSEKVFKWLNAEVQKEPAQISAELQYYEWLQWHIYTQWQSFKELAYSYKIRLKGAVSIRRSDYCVETFFKLQEDPADMLKRQMEFFSLLQINGADHTSLDHLYTAREIAKQNELLLGEIGIEDPKVQKVLKSEDILECRICHWEASLKGTPLPPRSFPHASFTTFSTFEHPPLAAIWNENRAILQDLQHEDKEDAYHNLSILGRISRVPFPPTIERALETPLYNEETRWGFLNYLLNTESRLTLLSIADLLDAELGFYQVNTEQQSYQLFRIKPYVEDFQETPELVNLQKELNSRIKLLRSEEVF